MTQGRRYVEPGRLRDPETGEWNVKELLHYLRGWLAVLVALAIVAGGVWYGGTKAWEWWMDLRTQDDYIGEVGVEDVTVRIPQGSSMAQIGKALVEDDVIKSADTFVREARNRPDEEQKRVQSGTFKMRTQISAEAAFNRLLDPNNVVRNMIQFKEGQRLSQRVAAMADVTGLPAEEFQAVLDNPVDLALPEWRGENGAEGFLFPETYELPEEVSPTGVIRLATTHFNKVAADLDWVNASLASPAEDPYQALIMASLVEREANSQEDRRKAARVFYNRMAQGMMLESDATVAYANNITGRVTTTPEERKIDSPYNTYLPANAGKLPPGPLTSPSKAAMEAAINPEEGNWLFFVVVDLDTGETVFSDTYDQHLQAVERFREFCRGSDKC